MTDTHQNKAQKAKITTSPKSSPKIEDNNPKSFREGRYCVKGQKSENITETHQNKA